MANNRMYLVHRPSNKFVFLGKRMANGWYHVPSNLEEKITELFSLDENVETQDDFVIGMEDIEHAPGAVEVWGCKDGLTLEEP